MTEIEFQNGSKIKGMETAGETIRGKVRGYLLDSKKKNRGGVIVKIMKKVLKGLWNNYFLVLGIINLVIAMNKGESNDAVIGYVIFIGCLILQLSELIIRKLNDMKSFYLKREEINANNFMDLINVLIGRYSKEDK